MRRAPHEAIAAAAETVEIREIGAGGVGVGRLREGRVVFVPGTVPGEEVVVEPVDVRRSWVRARLLRVRTPSPDRRTPPCPHAGRCGGCTLQHMRYERQLAVKAGIVRSALRHVAHDAGLPDRVVPSHVEFEYRNRVSFSLLRLGSGRVVAGFRALADPGRIVDVGEDCMLPERVVRAAWGALRREWGHNAERLPAGRRLRVTVRGSERGEVSMLIEGGHGRGRPEELPARVPGLVAVWQKTDRDATPRHLAGQPALAERWNRSEAGIAAAAFLQVNRKAAAGLEDWVMDRVRPVEGMRVVDAYCGLGIQAERMARRGAAVTGVELDAAAVEEARRRAGEAVRFLQGRVEDRLAEALPADVLIVNPPRAGLDAAVTRAVAARPPRRMFYVSCDPATLARDLDRLRGSLRVAAVRCFDLFPQTAHVETVVELQCATS